MKRHTLFFSLAIAAVMVLSACTITVEPGPPPPRQPDDTRTARNDSDNPVRTYNNIAAGADILVRIDVDTSRPALYLELDRDIDLEVFDASRSRIASASSRNFFGTGTTGLTTTAALEPQAVTVQVPCRGSCVILNQGTSSHYFLLIRNTSGSSQSVGLFAFGDDFADGLEGDNRDNDVASTAPFLNLTSGDSGALEVLGDVDYWRVSGGPATGTPLVFNVTDPAVGATLRVLNVLGDVVDGPITSGSFRVFAGETIQVSSDTNRAAASARSFYGISPP